MSINLFNNLDKDFEYAVSDSIDSSANFKFKKFPSKKPVNFKRENRYIAFKVPADKGFAITPKSRTFFEFIQVIPKSSKHGNQDIYLFQITKFDEFTSNSGGGDGDIDPPDTDVPFY